MDRTGAPLARRLAGTKRGRIDRKTGRGGRANLTVANDPGGTDVTLRARRLIVLQDGAVIEADTVFRAKIDPAL